MIKGESYRSIIRQVKISLKRNFHIMVESSINNSNNRADNVTYLQQIR